MTGQEIIDKAKTAIGVITHYQMGGDPFKAPGDTSDCSAFVWWVLGEHKCQKGKWWNTDAIYHAATAVPSDPRFVKLDKPEDGCLMVYDKAHNGGHTGHVAICANVATKEILDCCESKDGVHQHQGSYWWTHPGAIFLKYVG